MGGTGAPCAWGGVGMGVRGDEGGMWSWGCVLVRTCGHCSCMCEDAHSAVIVSIASVGITEDTLHDPFLENSR